MKWKGVCKDRFYRLLRFGAKNDGGWNECECEYCEIPDHDDMYDLLRDAALGQAVRPYFKSGNSVAVERATILRKDIAEYLDA